MPALRGGVIVEATSVPFGGLWPNASTITSILESEPLPGRCGHGTQLPSVVSSVGRFPPVPAVGFHVSLPHRPGGTLSYSLVPLARKLYQTCALTCSLYSLALYGPMKGPPVGIQYSLERVGTYLPDGSCS